MSHVVVANVNGCTTTTATLQLLSARNHETLTTCHGMAAQPPLKIISSRSQTIGDHIFRLFFVRFCFFFTACAACHGVAHKKATTIARKALQL
jgi:hypothetical protein